MTKYDLDFKLEIVKLVLECEQSYTGVAHNNGLSKSDVRKWVKVYQIYGEEGLRKGHSSYSGDFKLAVVEDMRNNQLSYFETSAKYNLGNHVVKQWERIYLEEGTDGLYKERRGRKINPEAGKPHKLPKDAEEGLIAENQRLRMENDYLKKLNALVRERELSEKKKKLR